MNLEQQSGLLERLARRCMPSGLKPRRHLMRLVEKHTMGRVQGGPFVGMKYISRSSNSAYYPKLVGVYEREIVGALESLIGSQPDVVIDIGAAEGYYAVGLALRLPRARVIAFEMDCATREMLRELAVLNGVADRVELRGSCSPAELRKALDQGGRQALICDVEGYEAELLNPDLLPELRKMLMLVEVHDAFRPGAGDLLRQRFDATHAIRRIDEVAREASQFPYHDAYTRLMPRRYVEWLLWEGRPEGHGMYWFYMLPR